MQVSVENTGGLGRRMTIAVPADKVDQEIENRLRTLAGQVKLSGFRPGKVPMKVVRSRYNVQVKQEVTRDLLQSSFYEAANQQNLRPAGLPKIEPQNRETGQPLQFTATFEVYPEIDLAPIGKMKIEKPVPDITEADLETITQRMRKQLAKWNTAERAAQQGDRVVCDFVGTVNGEPFEGNEGKLVKVEIGGKRFIPGFEEQLVGMKAGDERTLSLSFPENYSSRELAGKPVKFETKAIRVEEAELPEINAEFAMRFGIEDGNLDTLRAQVRENLEREAENMVKTRVKTQVMEQLMSEVKFELPRALLDFEVSKYEDQHNLNTGGKGDPFPRADFEQDIGRQLNLGLIMSEIIRLHNLSVSPAKLRETVEKIAQSYQDPDQVVKYYYADEERLSDARNMALEDEVVNWILGQSSVKEVPISIDALMNQGQTPK